MQWLGWELAVNMGEILGASQVLLAATIFLFPTWLVDQPR